MFERQKRRERGRAPLSYANVVASLALFVALFIGSAWLFRHAARTQPRH